MGSGSFKTKGFTRDLDTKRERAMLNLAELVIKVQTAPYLISSLSLQRTNPRRRPPSLDPLPHSRSPLPASIASRCRPDSPLTRSRSRPRRLPSHLAGLVCSPLIPLLSCTLSFLWVERVVETTPEGAATTLYESDDEAATLHCDAVSALHDGRG